MTHTCERTRVHLCAHTYTCMNVHKHIYIHTNSLTHTDAHNTHTHIHLPVNENCLTKDCNLDDQERKSVV